MERDRYSGGGFLEVGKAAASFCGKAWRRSDSRLTIAGKRKITVLCGREKREQFPVWNTTILFHMFRAGYRNGCFRLHRKVLVKSCVIFRCGPSFNSFFVLFFHAAQITYQETGILFAGPSGAGKTTQAKLWERFRNARIICNDRTLLRKQDGNGTATAIRWMDHSRCEAGKCMWRDASFW